MVSLPVQVLLRLPVGGAAGTHGTARIGHSVPMRVFRIK